MCFVVFPFDRYSLLMRAFGSGHWIRPPLTSLFLWPRILCLISADDLSVVLSKRLTFVLTSGPRDCLYGARFGHFPSTCPAYALVFFRCFVFLVHLHIDDLSCNDPIYDPSLRFFLLARNIDDPSASNEKKVGRGEDERVKGGRSQRTEITVRPIAHGRFTNARQADL